MRWMRSVLLALVVSGAGLAASCGGGAGDPDAGPTADAGPNDLRPDRIGLVNLIEGGGFLSVFASIQDGPELPTPVLAGRFGECAVYVRPPPASCDPACGSGVCASTNVCVPYPATVGVGDITVTGLLAPLVFHPGPFGYAPDPAPGSDLFDAGAAITVSAPGDAAPGFSANLTGVPTLEAPFQNLTLVDGDDAPVTWTPAGTAAIQIALIVGWHGQPPEAMMACETADDGAFAIPGAAISALPRASSSLEQHASWIRRFDRAVVASPAGPIELVAASEVSLAFAHP